MTRLVFYLLLILAVLLSSCSSLPNPPQLSANPTLSVTAVPQVISTLTPGADQQLQTKDLVGRIVDMDGKPIQGAQVESVNQHVTSDKDGWFQLSGDGLPQWITVTAAGFISRTRAGAPDVPVLFRLTPDDGKTVVLQFAGDTMFGRRFFDPNGDDFTADGLLPVQPTVDDHLKLLAPIKPLLENADFTVVNFDTTLSDQPFFPSNQPRPVSFHPTAAGVYASSPSSVLALKQSGIDVVDLGNNHNYDMLEPGLTTTLSILDQVGLPHFGAGTNEANAWAPAIVSSKGQTIAFLGCTTLRIPLNTPTRNDVPYVAADTLKKGGAAYCSETRLRAEIIKAKQQAGTVVVMIDGGKEYDPMPTNKMVYLASIAKQSGATLVIDHQPHVIGGFSWEDPALIAWSMGSFVADQTLWPALKSYTLSVYVRDGKVIRAYVEPLMLDGFIPHGLTGELADHVVRDAAGIEPGPFVMESGAMEMDLSGHALQQTYLQKMDGGSSPGVIIPVPQAQWISDFKGPGKLQFGRDLLWVGDFENEEVNSSSGGIPLWDTSTGSVKVGPDYAYEGEAGIHLERGAMNVNDVVTTSIHRIPVDPYANLSVTGMVRGSTGNVVQAQLSWYSATSGPSSSRTTLPIQIQVSDTWQPFRFDVQAPAGAVAVGLFFRLSPPASGIAGVDFDNVRLIEWAAPVSGYSAVYNYALLTGSGELTFTQQILPGAEQWLSAPTIK